MALHVGIERAGWRGLAMVGACFIGPAVALTAAGAWLYVRYGRLPAIEPYLQGIKPAVLAVILAAVWKLGRTAVKGWRLGVLGAAATALSLGPASEIVALMACGLAGMLWLRWSGRPPRAACLAAVPFATPALTVAVAGAGAAAGASLWKLGLFFLKIGAVLFGSGYVLVAFLQGGLVDSYGWLTQRQLLDAVAIGQLTPGPVLSTATFIGYLIAGWPGAAVATLGIFLPSFLFVVILNPLVPRLRESAWTAAFLDAVNVAAVGLMAAVTIQLGAAILTSWPEWTIAIAAAAAALFFRVNAAWLVLGGGVAGRLLEMLRG
jgi:chromate transporter